MAGATRQVSAAHSAGVVCMCEGAGASVKQGRQERGRGGEGWVAPFAKQRPAGAPPSAFPLLGQKQRLVGLHELWALFNCIASQTAK